MNETPETQTLVIPKDLHRALRIEAAKLDLGIGEAAAEAIKAWLKTKPAANAKRELQPA